MLALLLWGASLHASASGFNDGFEDGLWSTDGAGGVFQLDTSMAHSGRQSARATGHGGPASMLSPPIPVQPHGAYRIRLWIRSDFATSSTPVSLAVMQSDWRQQPLGAYGGQGALAATGGRQAWTQHSITLDRLDPNAAYIRLAIRMDGGATGSVWFDDVSVVSINQIDNPGFEAPLVFQPFGAWKRDSAEKHSGAYSMRVDPRAESLWATPPMPVNAAEVHELSLWIKTRGVPQEDGVIVHVSQLDAGGRALGWYQPTGGTSLLVKTGGTREWARYTARIDGLSPGTASIQVYLRARASASGTAWFDDLRLLRRFRDGFRWGVNGHAASTNSVIYPRSGLGEQLTKAADLGVDIYRVNLSPKHDPWTDSTDWTYLDEMVETAYAKGLQIYLVLYDGLGAVTLPPGQSLSTYYFERGRDIAKRYQGKVAYYQLGNELDNQCILDSTRDGDRPGHYSPERYAPIRDRLRALSEGVRAGDPHAKRVINIGWLHTAFLEMLNADGVQWEVNALDWYWSSAGLFRVLDRLQGYPQAEILIAESNVANGTLAATEEEQARYIQQLASEVHDRAPSKVKGYFVYELFDQPNAKGGEAHYGLIRPANTAAGQPETRKRAYESYRTLIRQKR